MTPERRLRLEAVLNKRQPDLTVLLENVTDPHNISAVMRTCDAVGVQDIYILNTIIPAHKQWSKKTSSSAAKWLTIHQFTGVHACIAALREKYDRIIATRLVEGAVSLYDTDLTKSTALIFGNEHTGVSEEISQYADAYMIIPQTGMIRSLNISVACAVTLYEAFRQKKLAGHYKKSRLAQKHIQEIKTAWGLTE